MMRFAEKTDLPKIMEIWQEGFGDSLQEISAFFSAFEEHCRICVWEEAGEPAGQLLLLPVWLHMAQQDKTAAAPGNRRRETEYIYAVATKKEFQNRGICTKLLEAVSAVLQKEQKGAVLVPASRTLAGFYEKRGFHRIFAAEACTVEAIGQREASLPGFCPPAIPNLCVQAMTAEEYGRYREKAFCGAVHIELPAHMLSYAIELYRQEGGHCVKLTCGQKEYGVLYKEKQPREAGEISIQEITAKDREEALQAAGVLLAVLGKKKACVQRSYETLCMGLPDGAEGGYFNLVLD